MKSHTLYNSCGRVRMREWMQGKLHERLKKQLQSLELRTKSGKRNGIFTRTRRNFLRFRYEKPTAPQRKTYGSNGGNIRFTEGKHKNNGNITRFSTRGLQKKFGPIYTKQQTEKGIKTFSCSSNYIRVTNFTKLFHKYNINMTL